MSEVPGSEHVQRAGNAAKGGLSKIKNLPPWALALVGVGGILVVYMVYKTRQAQAQATADPANGEATAGGGSTYDGGGGGYSDPLGYTDAGSGMLPVNVSGATPGMSGIGATVPSGAGASTSDVATTSSTDNAVTGENLPGTISALGDFVNAVRPMVATPTTGGGAPARPAPAVAHTAPKVDARGHTAAQRAAIRHSSPAKEKAYQQRLNAPKKKRR